MSQSGSAKMITTAGNFVLGLGIVLLVNAGYSAIQRMKQWCLLSPHSLVLGGPRASVRTSFSRWRLICSVGAWLCSIALFSEAPQPQRETAVPLCGVHGRCTETCLSRNAVATFFVKVHCCHPAVAKISPRAHSPPSLPCRSHIPQARRGAFPRTPS